MRARSDRLINFHRRRQQGQALELKNIDGFTSEFLYASVLSFNLSSSQFYRLYIFFFRLHGGFASHFFFNAAITNSKFLYKYDADNQPATNHNGEQDCNVMEYSVAVSLYRYVFTTVHKNLQLMNRVFHYYISSSFILADLHLEENILLFPGYSILKLLLFSCVMTDWTYHENLLCKMFSFYLSL